MTGAIAAQQIEIGAIVRIVAPGSRESEGEARVIPAMVTHQWPDGSLQLYCFHFQGSPLLQNAVRPEAVEMVMSRYELDAVFDGFNRRIMELENQIVAMGGKKYQDPLKFSIADDPR